MKYTAHIALLLLLGACTTGQYGPLLINPQDESLFRQGMKEWQAGHDHPEAFIALSEQYPESPLTLAAAALVECRQSLDVDQKKNNQLQLQVTTLERRQAQLHQEIKDCQSRMRALNEQILELTTSLEQSKKILLETEGR